MNVARSLPPASQHGVVDIQSGGGYYLQLYVAFIRNAFLTMLAYRMRYYTGILTYVVFVSVHYFIWQAVFANQPVGSTINGYTLADMITYIGIGWIARSFYFSDIDEEINELVSSGQISTYLIRPVDFQLMLLARATGDSLFRLSFFAIPIGITLFLLYPIHGPASTLSFALFILSSVLGFYVLAEVNFIIGLVSFYLKNIRGVMRAKYFIVQLCSGLLLPLAFFPPGLRLILDLLPFKAVSYLPLQLYLGNVHGNEIATLFATQLLWILALFVIGRLAWHGAAQKLTLQGG